MSASTAIVRRIQGELILLKKQLEHFSSVVDEYLNHACLIMYHPLR